MEFFKDFDYKKMLFRVFTLAYTAFLAKFCQDYNSTHDLVHALNQGLGYIIPGMVSGFGLDQLIFHTTKTK